MPTTWHQMYITLYNNNTAIIATLLQLGGEPLAQKNGNRRYR